MNKLIALHDSEMDHFGKIDKFPNYALMKISAYHKSNGDKVVWFMPAEAQLYDLVYSSKIFDFTPENPYLPENTIRGGTGYGIYKDLPKEIDDCFPDYTIYPKCDYAIGFLTRGCPNNCSWCYVPQKEGDIKPYRTWQEIVRPDTNKLTLMDNNILAHPHGIEQLRQLTYTNYRIDINQAMSVFLVTPEVADILSRIKWQKYIRFSVDHKAQIKEMYRVAELFKERGIPNSKLFIYILITENLDDDLQRIYSMRKLKSVTLYGMPYKDLRKRIMPKQWQTIMAQKYIYSGQWRTTDWNQWKEEHKYYFKEGEI